MRASISFLLCAASAAVGCSADPSSLELADIGPGDDGVPNPPDASDVGFAADAPPGDFGPDSGVDAGDPACAIDEVTFALTVGVRRADGTTLDVQTATTIHIGGTVIDGFPDLRVALDDGREVTARVTLGGTGPAGPDFRRSRVELSLSHLQNRVLSFDRLLVQTATAAYAVWSDYDLPIMQVGSVQLANEPQGCTVDRASICEIPVTPRALVVTGRDGVRHLVPAGHALHEPFLFGAINGLSYASGQATCRFDYQGRLSAGMVFSAL